MASVTVKVLTPADSYSLLSLDEVKVLMDIAAADTSSDEQLQMLIDQNSDTIAVMLNRILGKERVRETWRELGSERIFLTRWPVLETDIETIEAPGGFVLEPFEYEVEEVSGKITLLNAVCWPEPVVITYTGGYDLPDDAPPSLKQAAGLLIRQGKTEAASAAISGVRMIAHKESRIMFHPPSGRGSGTSSSGATASSSSLTTVDKLLDHYRRFPA